MTEVVEGRRSYKYRLYRCDKKDRHLRQMLFIASTVWNHFIALQKRYYRLTGKYISLVEMNKHVLNLRRSKRFALWQGLHSQVCQDVCRRVDDGYQRFFTKLARRPPKFRKAKKYRSFTFPQSGYKVDDNRILIAGVTYKFVKHRAMASQIKTLTVKRDSIGRLWLTFSVLESMTVNETSTGKSGGFDFGLKDFLVDDDGTRYASPEFYKQDIRQTRKLHRQLARKVKGSKGWKQARRALARQQARLADKRRDHHFKLAHHICAERDSLYFETLHLRGMKALWGRKVSDLGFAQFLNVVSWVAFKQGKIVRQIAAFTPTTQLCSSCGKRHNLTLKDRTLDCSCGLVIGRDHNAAINIKTVGASTDYLSGSKSKLTLRRRVDGRSPAL